VNKDLVRRLSAEEAAAANSKPVAPVPGAEPANPSPGTTPPAGASAPAATPGAIQPAAAPPPAVVSNPMPGDAPAAAKADPRAAEIDSLKAAFARVQAQPTSEAELEQAIAQFNAMIAKLGDSSKDRRVGKELGKYVEVMELRLAVRDALSKSNDKTFEQKHEKVTQQLASLEKNGFFKVIGRLLPSTVYDGTRLPKLYRVVSPEPGASRTLAYLQPAPGLDLDAKLGRIVGVAGDSKMDESLKANLIAPRRVEVLNLTPAGGSEPETISPEK
jgi:hypothetical protein